MKKTIAALIFAAGLATGAQAQEATATVVTPRGNAKVTAEIIAASSTKLVKGAPFSAEAVSESVQILPDGNKITRRFTTRMYRDSDGRFRREEIPGSDGSSFSGRHQMISIFDPVAAVRYILDTTEKTARRVSVGNPNSEGAVIVNGQPMSPAIRAQVETSVAAASGRTQIITLPGVASASSSGGGGKTESLGTRDFDGVQAEGTRTTTTIEAGAIGNERPIEIVYERWFSKDLQLIVYSRHSDPRYGEQTYRMTNISRTEPDRSLFTPPSDYRTLAEPPARGVVIARPQ